MGLDSALHRLEAFELPGALVGQFEGEISFLFKSHGVFLFRGSSECTVSKVLLRVKEHFDLFCQFFRIDCPLVPGRRVGVQQDFQLISKLEFMFFIIESCADHLITVVDGVGGCRSDCSESTSEDSNFVHY